MTASPFIDPLPPAVDEKLRGFKSYEESVHIQVAADVANDLTFGERWLVVTERRLLLISADGADDIVDLPLRDITAARVERFVGGGCLALERKGCAPTFLYFSSSLTPKFAEVARGITQLSNGESLSLPMAMEHTRCPKCRRLLAEKNDICQACMKKSETLRRITGYLQPYRARVVLLVPIMLTSILAELLPPVITQHIIDDVLTPRGDFGLLVWLVMGLVGVFILRWVCEVGRRCLCAWLGSRMTTDIRGQLYRSLQHLPLRFYDQRQVGMLMSRAINDAGRLEEFLVQGIPLVVIYGLLAVGILGLLCSKSWVLTLYILLPVPPIVLSTFLIWPHLMRDWGRLSTKWSQFFTHLSESISGIRVVKIFSQEQRERMRFDRRNAELLRATTTRERRWLTFFGAVHFVMSFGVFFAWYMGGRQVLSAKLTLGELVAFITYLWMLYWPLQWFWMIHNSMIQALAGAERIFEILDTPAEAFEDPDAVPMPQLAGRVRFHRVTFGYEPSTPVLHDIDLEVAPGERIGLVGRSGAGKTTMVNLLCRFYDVDQGRIEVDGVDLRQVRLKDLREQIGVVLQEPFLFSSTIAENISYGKPGASFEEIVQAAQAANAHGFILAQPDGYDTQVGERGQKLSGGERQRIAIARAILRDPKILLLDEATSAVDTQTERLIQEAIGRLATGRTTFIIAHRLSTVQHTDRLVVLERGRVVEVGPYDELMARHGALYNLVMAQRQTSATPAVSEAEAIRT